MQEYRSFTDTFTITRSLTEQRMDVFTSECKMVLKKPSVAQKMNMDARSANKSKKVCSPARIQGQAVAKAQRVCTLTRCGWCGAMYGFTSDACDLLDRWSPSPLGLHSCLTPAASQRALAQPNSKRVQKVCMGVRHMVTAPHHVLDLHDRAFLHHALHQLHHALSTPPAIRQPACAGAAKQQARAKACMGVRHIVTSSHHVLDLHDSCLSTSCATSATSCALYTANLRLHIARGGVGGP
jgi:hypothetical protein